MALSSDLLCHARAYGVTIIVRNDSFDNHTLPIIDKYLSINAVLCAMMSAKSLHTMHNLGVHFATTLLDTMSFV
jgi:hypothetical protein